MREVDPEHQTFLAMASAFQTLRYAEISLAYARLGLELDQADISTLVEAAHIVDPDPFDKLALSPFPALAYGEIVKEGTQAFGESTEVVLKQFAQIGGVLRSVAAGNSVGETDAIETHQALSTLCGGLITKLAISI